MRNFVLAIGLAAVLSGCASHEYVDRHLAALGQQQTSALATGLEASDKKAADAAAAAMARGDAAYALAEGKFVYAATLSDARTSFAAGRSQLSGAGKATLAALVETLKSENKNVFIEIRGHTDNQGSPAAKAAIGQARAEAVRLSLSMQGVALNRMDVISYADTNPVASNATEAGRAQNRRVEIVLTR